MSSNLSKNYYVKYLVYLLGGVISFFIGRRFVRMYQRKLELNEKEKLLIQILGKFKEKLCYFGKSFLYRCSSRKFNEKYLNFKVSPEESEYIRENNLTTEKFSLLDFNELSTQDLFKNTFTSLENNITSKVRNASFPENDLKYLFSTSLKVKELMTETEEILESIKNNTMADIEYPKVIEENFIKIVSNIMGLTFSKSLRYFEKTKEEALSMNNTQPEINKDIMNKQYKFFLKETREQVFDFFKIDKSGIKGISPKILVRCFCFEFPQSHPLAVLYKFLHARINEFQEAYLNGSEVDVNLLPESPVNGIIMCDKFFKPSKKEALACNVELD